MLSEVIISREWPNEPSEENFEQQARWIDSQLRQNSFISQSPVHYPTLREYVATFYYAPHLIRIARFCLQGLGFTALGSNRGMEWLIEHYGPAVN